MIIVVNAGATRIGGALMIYNQFISNLKKYIRGNKYYIFVDSSVPQPKINNVTYINNNDHRWIHRIYWDYIGCKKWLKENSIKPDVIVSLQNSGIITKNRQVIYYHQSIPLYNNQWNFFKKGERALAIYKYIYPHIIAPTFSRNTDIIVQTQFIKREFIKKYKLSANRVHTLFPDIALDIPEDSPNDIELQRLHYFIYPASGAKYKQHRTIVNAVAILKSKYPEFSKKVKILFTLKKENNVPLYTFIKSKNCEENFDFIGQVDHKYLMRLIKNCQALLFPSTIETIGLPLIEGAAMGKAIIASDKDYSKEVLKDYTGVFFLPFDNYYKWAETIKTLYEHYLNFTPIKNNESTWMSFFNIIEGN